MKTLFFIPYLFMFSIVIGQSDKIIGRPIKIGNLEVAQFDFPTLMNLTDAKKACNDLGNGWRLPTLTESDLLCENIIICHFVQDSYWCTSIRFYETYFCYPNYTRSLEESFKIPNELSKYMVRAVRSF